MKMNPERELVARAGAAALCLVLFSGCVGYQLGTMLPRGIDSVFIPTIVNRSDEPLVETELTRAVVEATQREGSLRIAPREQADAELEVVLNDYRLEPVGYQDRRDSSADEYRVVLEASVVMRRRSDGLVLAQSPRVSGDTSFYFAGDLASAKRMALPAAAEDLAQRIIETVVEAW